MAEATAHLVEYVLPEQPILQWVLSFPYPGQFSAPPTSHHETGRCKIKGCQ